MANELTFNQLATTLKAVVDQATGASSLTPTNTSEFVAVGQTALKTGYDPVMNAISQVLSKTIFSIRPYSEKFQGLRVDSQKWGNIVRKLSISDAEFVEDDRYKLEDGSSVDQYIVRKPNVLQTNFYGGDTFSDYITIFKDQLDTAFQGPEQWNEFLTMLMTNLSDRHAQARENLARACIANYIAGKYAIAQGTDTSGSVIHLLTEYNEATGLDLTAKTVMQPANYAPFMQWAYSRIADLSSLMTERSLKFHVNVENKPINRHTPYDRQKVFMYSPNRFMTESRVLADTYHDNYIRYAADETVNFWQSIETRDEIQVIPTYLGTDGNLVESTDPVTVSKIFGVIVDEEAAGYTILREWMAPTPFNSRGGYHNLWYHFDRRYYNDFTENGIVLLLD